METVKCSRSFKAVGNIRDTKLLPRAITLNDRAWRVLPSRKGFSWLQLRKEGDRERGSLTVDIDKEKKLCTI